MLHGFRQNAEVFRRRTGAFRKAVAKQLKEKHATTVEFVFLDAPLVVNDHGVEGDEASLQRSWWDATPQSGEGDSNEETQVFKYAHWSQTMQYIASFCDSYEEGSRPGPAFDGVVGFSQGACVAAMLTSRPEFHWIKFGILISAFPPRDPELRMTLYNNQQPVQVPCLHVWGDGDELIKPSYSRLLMAAFEARLQASFVHPGGHVVPSSREVAEAVEAFLARSLAATSAL